MNGTELMPAETRAIDNETFAEIKRLREVLVDIYGDKDLGCKCLISSVILFFFLKVRGYEPVLCQNDEHAFLTVDGEYLDLTLPQFNKYLPDIYYSSEPSDYHQINQSARSEEEIKTLLLRRRDMAEWPEEQNPFLTDILENEKIIPFIS